MKKTGFTLIEIVVVISIIALVVPAVFAIVFGILREQTKLMRLSTIKKEGDYILNVVKGTIKNNALAIHSDGPPTEENEKCRVIEDYTSGSALTFEDNAGDWFKVLLSTDKIASYSSGTDSTLNLNSDRTVISGFSIGCARSVAYSPPIVSLSFDICYAASPGSCVSTRVEETATLHYQTKIKLRNF